MSNDSARPFPPAGGRRPLLVGLTALTLLALPGAAVAGRDERNAPEAPTDLRVEGGQNWQSRGEFTLTWSNPDHSVGIDVAYYQLCPVDAQRACKEGKVNEPDPRRLRLTLPAPGDYTISVWLKDVRGREDSDNRSEVVHLRFDNEPPTSEGIELGAGGDPAVVSLDVSDKLSGVGEAEIELRSTPGGEARTLPVEAPAGSGRLTARIPELDVPPGSYEVSALVHDLAGNLAVIGGPDGDPLTLTLPLRERTGIAATAEITRVVRRCRSVLLRLRGRLVRRPRCVSVPTRAPVPLSTQDPIRVGHFERLLITGTLENAPDDAAIDVEGAAAHRGAARPQLAGGRGRGRALLGPARAGTVAHGGAELRR